MKFFPHPITISLFLLLSTTAPAAGEIGNYVVERVPLDHGVPLHLTYCILQSSDGFLWFGTMYGLVRYDGYDYVSYRYDPDDSTSITNDDVTALFEDSKGFLWVGTYGGGLNRLDRSTGTFERTFAQSSPEVMEKADIVWAIAEDHDGVIWCGTERAGLIGLKGNGEVMQFLQEEENPTSSRSNRVHSLDVDRSNRLWIVNQGGGLYSMEPGRGDPVAHRVDNAPDLRDILSVRIDREDRIWIASATDGIRVLDSETGMVRTHHTLTEIGDHRFDRSPRVSVLEESVGGEMIAGTSVGIVILNADPRKSVLFQQDRGDPRGLQNHNFVAMESDRSGILWVSSYAAGLSRLYRSSSRFDQLLPDPMAIGGSPVNHVLAVAKSQRGEIFAVTGKSLFSIAPSERTIREVSLPRALADPAIVFSTVFQDTRKMIWIGTRDGLFRLTEDFALSAVYKSTGQNQNSLSSNVIQAITEDREGRIWIGTNQGLNRFSYEDQTIRQYRSGKGSLWDEFILSLFSDATGELWIGTYGGTSVLDPETDLIRHYVQRSSVPQGISNNYALCFRETEGGALWVGTGGGLNRFNRATGTFDHYFQRDGLTNDVVAGMALSENGDLWISSQNGITRLDAQTGSFASFDAGQGLSGALFTPGAGVTASTGEIVFGGAYGVTVFDPTSIPVRAFRPEVVVTGFSLLSSSAPILGQVRSGDTLSLRHDQNFFRVGFASLDFMNPDRNLYSYRMENLDKDWISAGSQREAVYTGLDPGSYRLRIRGTNSDGVLSDQEATLFVTIEPPFWMTWWFRTLFLAFLLVGMILFHRARVEARLERAAEIQQARLDEGERIRQKAARDFHDEFGHRLTRIGLFAEIVKGRIGPSSPETTARIDKIIEASQALTDDTRSFLWTLDPANDSLFELVAYLNAFGEELFDRTGISFRPAPLTESMKEVTLSMDFRRHLALILKEAMNNALRHSQGTSIQLLADVSENKLRVSLSDDGKGLASGSAPGGHGMKNMRLRAEKINGAINIESGPGEGTRVVFAAKAA